MISHYPQFTPITIDLKDEVERHTSKFDLYSDFTFVNLFAWNTDGKAGLSWLNGNLIVNLHDYVEGDTIYSIIGNNEIDETLITIFDDISELRLVPQIVIENLSKPEVYAIAEDRDSFDYIYNIDELSALNGSRLKNKRQKIRQTREKLGNRLSFSNEIILTDKLKSEMLDVLDGWKDQTKQPSESIALEEVALKRLFDHFDTFSLTITTMRLDNALKGFSINEIINEKQSICHFEKSLTVDHDGLYAVLINEAAKALEGKSKIVNWEQDLGIPGLKHIKRSYAPTKYHRKYIIAKPKSLLVDN